MAAQRGKDILLKLFDAGTQAFVSVAGLRTKRVAFGARTVDITDTESAGRWRELLGGAGIRRASLSGTGIFKDAASDALVRQAFFDGTIAQWRIVIPDFGTITGAFAITALDYAGNHDGEVTFDLALESASQLTFAAL